MTDTERKDMVDLIDRENPNDFDAIFSMTNVDTAEVIHSVEDNADAIYTWDYEKGARPQLAKLYEKAKGGQWNGETDLPWDTPVDQERAATEEYEANGSLGTMIDFSGTGVEKWQAKDWIKFNMEAQNWGLSQFMHGEQGALVCTAKIVETVPWIDAKYYAATQVVDEARHVEVFAKYLDMKMTGSYPINVHLRMLLDDIIRDPRWDMTYLGMQIMVEGLALAAFGFMYQTTQDPLLKKLLRYVMSDEARHVAFGVISLKEAYLDMSEAELLERQEFAFEAALRMRDRFLQQEVWERMGADVSKIVPLVFDNPDRREFQHMLFTKIVPNLKKLGLLDAGSGWLRKKFGEIGVIQYEDWQDTAAEVDAFALTNELDAENTFGRRPANA
ncbi:MAG TPA: hypothetical protein DEP66_04770 [Acidimicrobiaceae bacterium]|nr:hypothetical protein [Acidimicrobiaceae bacterium]HCB37510.1 hypothetical protein [Acidimicrobiaceae bacterium]